MYPTHGQGSGLLHELAKRAKRARRDGNSPDNEGAIRSYNEQLSGAYPWFIGAAIFFLLLCVVSLV